MQINKIRLSFCPNFDKITNATFLEGDSLSIQLVRIYRDFIFKINVDSLEDTLKAQELDKTMGKYVDDYFFRKTLQEEIVNIKIKKCATDILRSIVESIIGIFKRYEEGATRKIYISRWI